MKEKKMERKKLGFLGDIFGDDLDDEDEKVKNVLKLMDDMSSFNTAYGKLACKILKEQSNENKLSLSEEEQSKINDQVAKIEATFVETISSCKHKEFVYEYFYIAYYCKGAYKEIFTKEKAKEYLRDFISYGGFVVSEFIDMFEEGTKDHSVDRKRELFLEVFEEVTPMVNVVNIRDIQMKREQEFMDRLKTTKGEK